MKKYLYHVYANGVFVGSGSIVEAEKIKKEIKRIPSNYNVTIEKTTLCKHNSGYR